MYSEHCGTPRRSSGAAVVARQLVDYLARGNLIECSAVLHPEVRFTDAQGAQLVGWHACMELVRRAIYRLGRLSVEVLATAAFGSRARLQVRLGATDNCLNGIACWTVTVEDGLVRDVRARRPDGLAAAKILVPELV